MKAILKFWFYFFNWNRVHEYLLLTPYEKRDRIKYFAERMGAKTFVETGSYHGDTSKYLATVVDRVVTIEIDPKCAEVAKQNCSLFPNITVYCGSSEDILPRVLAEVSGPTLFWLDSHSQLGLFRGKAKCPVLQELDIIASFKAIEPIIMIDDARKFIWVNGWPSLSSLRRLADRHGYDFRIAHDMICIGRFEM
jgi:hypothetical protein